MVLPVKAFKRAAQTSHVRFVQNIFENRTNELGEGTAASGNGTRDSGLVRGIPIVLQVFPLWRTSQYL